MTHEDTAALTALALEPRDREPLYMQIYDQVRDLILAGRLGSGARLPSTRALAADLGVSRTTTLAAYDQLGSEGYIEGHRGSGAFVAAELPDALLSVASGAADSSAPDIAPAPGTIAAFDAGVPDTRGFPFRDWSRHLAHSWRAPPPWILHTAHSQGDAALRAAIARHVKAVRGIACTPEQVVVTSGAAESIAILARALFDDGDGAVIENPCYPVAERALARAGLSPHPVDVDADGLMVDAIAAAGAGARLKAALVTPSRQYPLGMTMSVSRRLELLDWASRNGALVIEDDYDSEYRYTGRPLAAMMSLDQGGRVVYLGSFSKIMFRSLRLAYIIAPPALLGRLRASLAEQPSQASLVPQQALAAFMDSGAFAQHVRRTRRLYAERYTTLHALLAHDMAHLLTAPLTASGMHLTAHFTPALEQRMSDTDAAARARGRGVVVSPLSVHYRKGPSRAGFLMGFAGYDGAELARGVAALRNALEGAN